MALRGESTCPPINMYLYAIDYINNERDVDFFHWSSVRMSEFWRTSFDVTLASHRARVGTAAAEGGWRKTVQQYGLAEA